VSGYQELWRCVAVTVTQPGGRQSRIFMHRRAWGDRPHLPRTVRRHRRHGADAARALPSGTTKHRPLDGRAVSSRCCAPSRCRHPADGVTLSDREAQRGRSPSRLMRRPCCWQAMLAPLCRTGYSVVPCTVEILTPGRDTITGPATTTPGRPGSRLADNVACAEPPGGGWNLAARS
jgi:hypothetical protein